MSTAVTANTTKRASGGSFLIEDLLPEDIFTPEDFSTEQKQIAQMTIDFAEEKILPRAQEIEEKHFEVSRSLMREAGELGLLSVDVPEEYGGLELDKVTSALIADKIAVSGSFSVTFSAHPALELCRSSGMAHRSKRKSTSPRSHPENGSQRMRFRNPLPGPMP